MGILAVSLGLALPAAADTGSTAMQPMDGNGKPPAAASATDPVLVNLIRLLVEQKVITPEAAEALLAQAQAEAARTRAGGAAVAPLPGAAGSGTVRVPYVPEPVRRQIKDELKQEVLAQAKQENWATPYELPEWTKRIDLFGRVRTRYEHIGYDGDNAPAVDFNAINTGPPVDVGPSATQNPPLLNTDQDRNRFRLMSRLGVKAQIDDWVSAAIALGTGSDNGPVSLNQTLGGTGTTGQGGNFSKYNIWLDEAYIRFKPLQGLMIDVGRAPNPFFYSDLLFDTDVQFDGLSVSGQFPVNDRITPFFTLGGFPVYNTNLNFSTYSLEKESSNDRYLFGSQIGLDTKPAEKIGLKVGLANYYFLNMRGKRSSLCLVLNDKDQCDTDNTRPQFAQQGNTYFALRDIEPTAENGFGSIDQFQYFGLASNFNLINFLARADFAHYDPIHIILQGDFVANLGFDEGDVADRGPGAVGSAVSDDGNFEGGNLGFGVTVEVGYPEITKLWDWQAFVGYKYVESDAVVDGLTDSDFHLGGTNAQGYILGGRLGIAKNTWLTARWLSANEVNGPPLGIDVFQFDLNARF